MVLEADNHFLLSVLGAILVVIVILLYAFRCTKLVKKSSPIDAIRSGQTGNVIRKIVVSSGQKPWKHRFLYGGQ